MTAMFTYYDPPLYPVSLWRVCIVLLAAALVIAVSPRSLAAKYRRAVAPIAAVVLLALALIGTGPIDWDFEVWHYGAIHWDCEVWHYAAVYVSLAGAFGFGLHWARSSRGLLRLYALATVGVCGGLVAFAAWSMLSEVRGFETAMTATFWTVSKWLTILAWTLAVCVVWKVLGFLCRRGKAQRRSSMTIPVAIATAVWMGFACVIVGSVALRYRHELPARRLVERHGGWYRTWGFGWQAFALHPFFAEYGPIHHVDVTGPDIRDEQLATIARLRSLRGLILSGTAVTDRGLDHLAGLSELESLHLYRTSVTDAGVVSLRRRLPGLRVER